MSRLQVLALGALLLATSAFSQKRVLVLLGSESLKEKYSSFFGSLESRGFTLDVKGYKDSSLKLKEYDTWHYEHLLLFCPKAEGFGGTLDLPSILEFIDSGRNVLVGVNSDVSDTMRALAAEVGVELEEKGTSVFDHFGHAVVGDQADHTLIAANDAVDSKAILPHGLKAPVLFRGVAATVDSASDLVTVALSAPVTAYSTDPRKAVAEPPALMAGPAISLVSVVQARNNARVLVSGSLDLFTNTLFDAEIQGVGKSANADFALSVARWTLQDQGVLRAENLRHRHLSAAPGDAEPLLYRVLDDVEFAVDIFEYDGDRKLPYKADDVQVEFVMLDPYVRAPLKHDGNGVYSLRFKVPDVYGVFKYVVDYKRRGYSYIQLVKQMPVRPFKHNEYERFLVCAYPYYASALSGMVAFFALGWFFLYHK